MNTQNGYAKSTLTNDYLLTAAGGHKSLSDFVQLTGTQTISGNKTFSSSVTIDDLIAGNLVVSGGASFAQTINGNAATASKLATARTISLTGSVTGSGNFDGSGNLSIDTTTNHTHSYLFTEQISAGQTNITWAQGYSNNRSFVYNTSGVEWSYLFGLRNDKAYGAILKMGYSDKYLRILRINNNSWQSTDWEKISAGYADSAGNATNDSDGNAINSTYLKKSGGTMTGALTVPSISVTGAATFSQAINGSILGNAATASRLYNARTIWGKSFDGSANVSGAMSGVTTVNGVVSFTNKGSSNPVLNIDTVSATTDYVSMYVTATHRPLVLQMNAGNVGIDVAQPTNKLDVAGAIGLTGQLKSSVATGTAPLVVASTTAVSNLNADLLDGQHGSYYATASSVYSILNIDGSNESGANNIKYYSVTDLYPSTETLGVQYLITCSDTESYIISFGTSRSDSSQIYCDIVALNIQYTLDEFKFSNRTLYFKHDARTASKYYDIQIKQISGPKKSPSKSLITETAYNNIGSSYVKTPGYIYNSNNSSCYIRHNQTSTAYYYRISGLMGDDSSGFAESQHLYTISCREGFYLLQCLGDHVNMYTIKAGGIVGFKYVRGYYYGDSPGGLYLYITSGNATFTGNTTIRQIGGLPSKLTVEEISSSTYDGLSGAVTTNESRTFYHSGNLNPENYTMHYDTVSDSNEGILYIPDNVDGPNYFVHTIESSNSTTSFYYMWLDGQPSWTCYYNYMRHQLIINKKSVDVIVQMNLPHEYYAPATSFVIPAGYAIELSIYQHSKTDPMMITWSSPLRCPS